MITILAAKLTGDGMPHEEGRLMRERLTARVLLFDPEGRLLLMQGRASPGDGKPRRWFPVGGGADPGEGVMQAAAREALEETGIQDIRLGPAVWRRLGVGRLYDGEVVTFNEHYVVGFCGGGDISRAAWEAHEHDLVDDIRWWSLDEMLTTTEILLPEGLTDLLPDILAGRYPDEPIELPTRNWLNED